MGTELPCPVDLIIPYQPTGSLREANLHRLLELWLDTYPGLRVHVGLLGDGPWNKARALDRAIEYAEAPVWIVADADVWVDERFVRKAVTRIAHGATPWVIPHHRVLRLDESSSRHWTPGHPGKFRCERAPYPGVPGGGMFVVRGEDYRRVPMDARFTGHGGQDIAWAHAADTLIGRHMRLHGDLWHLHHEVQPTKDDPEFSRPNFRLMAEYARCRGRAGAMRRLVEAGRVT